jgi:methanogenic corrinoid protein MtbC1
MAKRRGLDVHYLGADLPTGSWVAAVEGRRVDAAVLAVPMAQDRPAAEEALRAMQSARPDVVFAVGGAHSDNLAGDVLVLPPKASTAAEELDERLHQAPV